MVRIFATSHIILNLDLWATGNRCKRSRQARINRPEEHFGGMMLKRLQVRKDVGWRPQRRELQWSDLEVTNEAVRVTIIVRGINWRTCFMAYL